jgi:hypothetical protein
MIAKLLLMTACAAALAAPSRAAAVSKSTDTGTFASALPDGWSPREEPDALILSGPVDENRLKALIVVRYYPAGDKTFSSADAYVKRQSAATIFDPPGAKPASVSSVQVAGVKARRIARELAKTANPGRMNSKEIPSREELVVVPGKSGFYVLSYAAPLALYDGNRTAFLTVLNGFKPKK